MWDASALARAVALQHRICASTTPLPTSASQLLTSIRAHLVKAVNTGLLKNSLDEVTQKFLKLDDPIKAKQYNAQELAPDFPQEHTVAIMGGVKNQHRVQTLPHFKRDDGAWFDFSITVFEDPKAALLLLSYDFEIRFPSGEPTAYLRLDLNPPSNRRPDKMRCHLHPATEDDELCTPAPWLQPIEALDLFIHGFRRPERLPRHRKGEDDRTRHRNDALYDAIEEILRARALPLSAEVAEKLLDRITTSPHPALLFHRLINQAVLVEKAADLLDG